MLKSIQHSCEVLKFAVVILLLANGLGCEDAVAVKQPIPFNHALHVVDNEMSCQDCHRSVETTRVAGRPGVSVCADCHDVMLGHSEDEKIVVAHVEQDDEIPWRRIYRVSQTAFFSHARHVSAGGIECQTCHGPMQEQEVPPSRPLVALTMDDCIGCHRERAVRDDCNACHR